MTLKEINSFVDNSIYSLANLYEKKGEYTEAVKYYDKLLGFHKDSELAGSSSIKNWGVLFLFERI